jgi:arylsulfatase A-like enzyme
LKRAFSRQLAATAVAVLAAAMAEAGALVVRQASNGALQSLSAAGWCFGLWAVPGAFVALALALVLALSCGEESLTDALRLAWTEQREALALGSFALSTLIGWVFVLVRGVERFHNRELAAALVATSVALAALLLASAALGLRRWLRARAARGLGLAAVVVPLLVAGGIALACRAGLAQLDARLWLAPVAFFAAFIATDRYWARRAGLLPVIGALALASVGFFWLSGSRASTVLATEGAWSRPLLAALQQLSDVDRDGYSSVLGGGDCAPFDPKINPGAVEVAGDGVDNNCIGGDGGKASAPRRPTWGASAHGSPTNQNVVIVTIETLRRDHASFIGAAHDTTPNLRTLASSSLVFERMYSAAPYTRLALASLFSSYAPSELEWQLLHPDKHMRRIGPQTPWLPELLSARGYETIAVLTDFSAFTSQEDVGFERGFRHYDTSTQLQYRGGTMWGFPAAEQVDKALGYLERARRPFLLWLHLFEPHYRYEQPPGAPVFGSDERSRYDAEIWYVDQQLGRLVNGLRKLELWDSTVLFVTGDHGEAFGEHDDRWHGTNLFDPQLRPAALLRVPGVNGKRLDVSVTFTDIAPTLARVLGDRQTFDALHGRSLAPLMHHRTLPEGENSFVAETFNIEDGRSYQAALVAHPLKLIYSEEGQRFSLYDLADDPSERQPLDPSSDPRAAPLARELIGYLERNRPRVLPQR